MTGSESRLLGETDTVPTRKALRSAGGISIGAIIALLCAAGVRLWVNAKSESALEHHTTASLRRTVAVIHARSDSASRDVSLPATLRGYEESIIYARTSGYVSSWLKTIGDRVHKGELLATLSAPEQEQELIQARAVREQVKARADLTAASLVRWEAQHQYHVISEQDFEEKRSADRQARADLAAAGANVRRLEQLLALQRIVAPFDGIITRRSIDVGVLVSPGTKELFALSQTNRLRLTVWVPQVYANDVQVGQPVDIKVNEIEHRTFAGFIEHVSGGIDTGTNARQVEIIVPNDNDELLPGSYANVHLSVMRSTKSLLISPNALLFGRDGPRVIVVGDGNRLSYHSVELGRDFGEEIEVLAGITREDAIVVNPSQLLQEDEIVGVRSADGRATVPAVSSSIPSPARSAGS